MLVGERIKALRKIRKMKLKELAERSGVQIATLSRIEHKKMTGTVDSHLKIAKALNVDITELYKEIKSKESLPTAPLASSAAESFSYNNNASYEILGVNVTAKRMLPLVLRIEPNGKTIAEQNHPDAEKFIFVLEGKIDIHIGDETHSLNANDTLYFKAAISHVIENTGKKPARLISIVSPAIL